MAKGINYNIFIPQLRLLQVCPKISSKGAFILDYISRWQLWSWEKARKIIPPGERDEFIWLNYPSLIRALPILRIKNRARLGEEIDKLAKYKLLKKYKERDNTVYVRLTDLAVNLYAPAPFPAPLDTKSEQLESKGSQHLKTKGIQHNPYTNQKDTISSKSSKTTEWNFKSMLTKMKTDKNRHIQIIGLYWEFKVFEFENPEQYKSALARELRAARRLIGYKDDRLLETMDWLENETDMKWTLETLHKFIDENLEELEPMRKSRIKH